MAKKQRMKAYQYNDKMAAISAWRRGIYSNAMRACAHSKKAWLA